MTRGAARAFLSAVLPVSRPDQRDRLAVHIESRGASAQEEDD